MEEEGWAEKKKTLSPSKKKIHEKFTLHWSGVLCIKKRGGFFSHILFGGKIQCRDPSGILEKFDSPPLWFPVPDRFPFRL